MLYRVFPLIHGARLTEEGGALYVARDSQGSGRHDNPGRYGALYVSRAPESAVAERIQGFRGQELRNSDLRRQDGSGYALAEIDDASLGPLVDLDDPSHLTRRRLRPSIVATRDRAVTRPTALAIFAEGAPGFEWWSTLESRWINVTLFAGRAVAHLALATEPAKLTVRHPVLRSAAELIGVRLRD